MQSKTCERRLRALERKKKAWKMRIAGHHESDIAKVLGVSQQQISRDLSDCYPEYQRSIAEKKVEFGRLHMARLEELLTAVWATAKTGDDKAIKSAVQILKQQAMLLGLNAVMEDKPQDEGWNLILHQILKLKTEECANTREVPPPA